MATTTALGISVDIDIKKSLFIKEKKTQSLVLMRKTSKILMKMAKKLK